MEFKPILLFMLFCFHSGAQNDLHITSLEGTPFVILHGDSQINPRPAANVIYRDITTDTLVLEIRTGNGKGKATVYLLDRGRKTNNREFNYVLTGGKDEPALRYSGMSRRTAGGPQVPEMPEQKENKTTEIEEPEGFAEIGAGKIRFRNNIPEEGCRSGMPENYVQRGKTILSGIRRDDERLGTADSILKNNCVTIEQLRSILEHVPYELDRLKLVKQNISRIVDPQKYDLLRTSFRFESSFRELEAYFTNRTKDRTFEAGSSGLTNTQLDTLVIVLKKLDNDGLRIQFLKHEKHSSILLNSQTEQILRTFIHDNYRLEAAKLLYYRSPAKKEFGQLGKCFNYPGTARELDEFLRDQEND